MNLKKIFSVLGLGLVLACFSVSQSVASADLQEKSRVFVEKVANQAISEVAGKEEFTDEQAQESFRKLLKEAFDMDTIARFTLGRYWRTASSDEKKNFKSALEDLIVRSYTKRLKDYNGQGFEVVGAQKKSDKDVEVNMLIYPDASKKNPVDLVWRVRATKGVFKIIDLAVEGVSMSFTQRTEFASVIQRNGGSLQALIDSLNEKEKLE